LNLGYPIFKSSKQKSNILITLNCTSNLEENLQIIIIYSKLPEQDKNEIAHKNSFINSIQKFIITQTNKSSGKFNSTPQNNLGN